MERWNLPVLTASWFYVLGQDEELLLREAATCGGGGRTAAQHHGPLARCRRPARHRPGSGRLLSERLRPRHAHGRRADLGASRQHVERGPPQSRSRGRRRTASRRALPFHAGLQPRDLQDGQRRGASSVRAGRRCRRRLASSSIRDARAAWSTNGSRWGSCAGCRCARWRPTGRAICGRFWIRPNPWPRCPSIPSSTIAPANRVAASSIPSRNPAPGEWHSPWESAALDCTRAVVRKVLSHHAHTPASELRSDHHGDDQLAGLRAQRSLFADRAERGHRALRPRDLGRRSHASVGASVAHSSVRRGLLPLDGGNGGVFFSAVGASEAEDDVADVVAPRLALAAASSGRSPSTSNRCAGSTIEEAERHDRQQDMLRTHVPAKQATGLPCLEQQRDRFHERKRGPLHFPRLRDVPAVQQILVHDHAHEVRMGFIVIPRMQHQLAHSFHWIVRGDERPLLADHLGVDLLEHRLVQALLVAVVVVQHAVHGAGRTADALDAGAGEAVF